MGLIEALDEADVLAWEDPNDADGDGNIPVVRSGLPIETGDTRLGRFGWKAGTRVYVTKSRAPSTQIWA